MKANYDLPINARGGKSYLVRPGCRIERGMFVGLADRVYVAPFYPGENRFLGLALNDADAGERVPVYDGVFTVKLPGVTSADLGRELYSPGPTGPVTLDVIPDGRVAYVDQAPVRTGDMFVAGVWPAHSEPMMVDFRRREAGATARIAPRQGA
jgi:hypothetical protein